MDVESKRPHIVNIIVEEINGTNKENEQNEDSDDDEVGEKKKKKVCICVILLQLLNLIILFYRNNHLSTLQTMRRWKMFESFMKSGPARSWDPPAGALTALLIQKPKHIFHLVMSLGDSYGKILNAHVQKYEFYRNICQMNPNGAVTLRQLPNNKLFDPSQTTHISPVVQCRKAEQAGIASSTLSAGPPVFNISLGNDFAKIFHPAPPLTPAPAPLAPLPQPVITQTYLSLLPPSREPRIDMARSEFCTRYGFSNEILIKLKKWLHMYPDLALCPD
jgi:hypothetical protein